MDKPPDNANSLLRIHFGKNGKRFFLKVCQFCIYPENFIDQMIFWGGVFSLKMYIYCI